MTKAAKAPAPKRRAAAGPPPPPQHSAAQVPVAPAPSPAPGGASPRAGSESPVASAGAGRRVRSAVQGLLSGTPGRMRLLGAAAAAAALLFGVVAAGNLLANDAAAARATTNTGQVVRVQKVYADLLLADATATNAFLVGGLEAPEQRATYEQAMDRATRGIAEAASVQPADAEALAALSAQVQRYGQLVEQARAYNRQGLPVGAQYLTLASAGLRSDAAPVLAALLEANSTRTANELDNASWNLPLAASGALAVVVFVLVMLWFARRTHRYLNLPLAAGTVALLAAAGVAVFAVASTGRQLTSTQDDQLAATIALSTARTSAYDAKANESLTLIRRGSGAAFEKAWQTSAARVTASLTDLEGKPSAASIAGDLAAGWSSYATAHQAIRAADDSGTWDDAVQLASASGATTGNAAFTAFADATTRQVDSFAATTATRIAAATSPMRILGWVMLAAALASAVLALRGVAKRIEDYR